MVKCFDCGFLCAYRGSERAFVEASMDVRTRGQGLDDPGVAAVEPSPGRGQETFPHCFVRAASLPTEIPQTPGGTVRHVICKERDCPSFTPWRQGFSPKEHREMIDRKEIQDWKERQQQDERRFQVIMAILLALVAGLFTLLGAYIAKP